jgi:outer membrane protein assembly factor BamE (lipoprotein component of BamABCDE complex)
VIAARSILGAAAVLMASALLAGCATPASVRPGASAAEVIGRFGAPAVRHRLADGTERLEYPEGGLQQQTWMIDIDASGRVTAARQVMTAETFSELRVGINDRDDVLRTLGRPWRIEHYRASGLTAWLYPYREDAIWNSVMAVHFNADGRIERMQSGPDPRFLGGGNRD